MDSHAFCRAFLSLTRKEGKFVGTVPKNITAVRIDKHWFFVEADGVEGVEIQAECCAYEARAKYIHKQLRVEEAEDTESIFDKKESRGSSVTPVEQIQDIAVRIARYPGRTIQETVSGHIVSGRLVVSKSDERGIYKLDGKRIGYPELLRRFDE